MLQKDYLFHILVNGLFKPVLSGDIYKSPTSPSDFVIHSSCQARWVVNEKLNEFKWKLLDFSKMMYNIAQLCNFEQNLLYDL